MNKEFLVEIFRDMPTLRTERLTLRRMRPSDAADMYSYASRPETSEHLLWSPHKSIGYTKEYLKFINKRYAIGDFYDWAIVENASSRMIGTCGFTRIDIAHKKGEIGYVLNPDFQRKGYAPEAATEIIKFGFSALGLHRIEARFMVDNVASRKVTEKLGMTFEREERDSMLVKGRYRTIGIASILENEYKTR